MTRNYKELMKALSVGLLGIVIGGTVVYFMFLPSPVTSCTSKQYVSNDNISLGDKILVKEDRNPSKEAGVKSLADGYCTDAIQKFNDSLKINRNDPETLIYLNNAKARLRAARLKIGVSVPIGSNSNVAKEILRGVAQAQDEENHDNGINGKLLEVEIANDNNLYTLAQNVATQFVDDSSLLAVVGHNASEASLSAAPVYQANGLVMISPTSFALDPKDIGNYIFRIVPSSDVLALTLFNYISSKNPKANIAICFDSKSSEAGSFKIAFEEAIKNAGRKVNLISCDFSAPTFNPSLIISQAINNGADSLLLFPHVDRIDKALDLVHANQVSKRPLDLFGNSTLYTYQTLKDGKANVNGMILVVTWFPSDKLFRTNPERIWGGRVTWRTAMAYKATQEIITGLKQSSTREGLQQFLQRQDLGNGSNSKPILVKVSQKSTTETGYEFTQLSP